MFKSELGSNNTTIVVQESSREGDNGYVLTVSISSFANAWFLDSRASYHMTYNCDWFCTFEE